MKKRLPFILSLLLGSLLVIGATYDHKQGGLSIWFPDTWKVVADGDELEADAPGGDAFAHLLMIEDAASIDAAVDALASELDPIIDDFKTTNDGQEIESGGLKFYIVEGEGKVDDVKMGVSVALIGTNSGKVCMMLLFCPSVVYGKYEKDFDRIVQSIKAI